MSDTSCPAIQLRKGHAKPLHSGHPWVFASAVASKPTESIQAGDEVRVLDAGSQVLGRGYYSPDSAIAVRLLTRDDQPVDETLLGQRISEAHALRRDLLGLGSEGTTAYRLIHSEGDGLPGLTVDVYGEYLCVQFGTAGMVRRKGALLDLLNECLNAKGVLNKSDARMLRLEKLKPVEERLLAGDPPPDDYIVTEHGIPFQVDLKRGQKTGLYLDQRENRVRFASFARGRHVLDAFAYSGAFSLHAARVGATSLTLVDSSEPALTLAKRNLEQNDIADADLVCAPWKDAFRLLREQKRQYGLVVLDPPKFAQTRSRAQQAMAAYRDLNAQAARLIEAGGVLFTCSCSGNVSEVDFERAVASGLSQSGRRATVLERRGSAPDHPTPPGFENGRYLKCLIMQLD